MPSEIPTNITIRPALPEDSARCGQICYAHRGQRTNLETNQPATRRGFPYGAHQYAWERDRAVLAGTFVGDPFPDICGPQLISRNHP